MYRYRVVLKSCLAVEAECKFLDILTIQGLLNEHQPFVAIGNHVFAKDSIAYIEKIETEEKEN